MHLKRWITSIVALPFLILLIGKGGPFLFAIFICIICQFALQEYFTIVYHKSRMQSARILAFIGYLTGLLIISSTYKEGFNIVSVLITLNILVAGLIAVLFYKSDNRSWNLSHFRGWGLFIFRYCYRTWSLYGTVQTVLHGFFFFW